MGRPRKRVGLGCPAKDQMSLLGLGDIPGREELAWELSLGESCSSETKLGQASLRPLLRVSEFRKKPI